MSRSPASRSFPHASENTSFFPTLFFFPSLFHGSYTMNQQSQCLSQACIYPHRAEGNIETLLRVIALGNAMAGEVMSRLAPLTLVLVYI